MKNFRIGQRVQSAEDVSRVFVIRKSRIPGRIYFGANRWWTKNELQAIGAAENPVTSHRLSGIGNAFQMRSNAYKCVTSEPQVAPEGLEERNCPFCRASFQMKRKVWNMSARVSNGKPMIKLTFTTIPCLTAVATDLSRFLSLTRFLIMSSVRSEPLSGA